MVNLRSHPTVNLEYWDVLLKNIPSGVIVAEGTGGKITYVNDRAIELLGFNPSGFELKEYSLNMAKALKLDDRSYLYDEVPLVKALVKGQVTRDQVITLQRPNNSKLTLLENASPITKKSEIVGAVAIFEDVTERKKTEAALRESEERFRHVAEAANVLVYEFDVESGVIAVLRGLEAILGYKPDEVDLTDWWLNQIHPDDRLASGSKLARAIEMGVDTIIEYRVRRKQGDYIVVHDALRMVKNGEGEVIRIVGGMRDVTGRKQAEDALRKHGSLIDLSSDAIIVKKLDDTITFWSQGAQNLYGYTKEEAVGKKSFGLFNANDPGGFEEIVNKLESDGRWFGERIHKTKSGGQVTVDSRWLASCGAQGEIEEIFETDVDITDLKHLQEKLEEYSNLEKLADAGPKLLKDAERLATVGQVALMVGHDIGNPLQAILSELYFAKRAMLEAGESKAAQDALASINVIEEQADSIRKVISGLQDYAGPLKPVLVKVDVCEAVDEALKTINLPSNVQVRVVCEENLPRLRLDVTFLKRILMNLIDNAVKAMPDGGQIAVAASKADVRVVITVEDTGVGIPENLRSKLFAPLFTTQARGHGFGLPVVRRLVEALHGTVTFESHVGKGTKFIVSLPAPKS